MKDHGLTTDITRAEKFAKEPSTREDREQYLHISRVVRSVGLLVIAEALLSLCGCNRDEPPANRQALIEREEQAVKEYLADYWQNPPGLELKLLASRSELQLDEELTIREILTNDSDMDLRLSIFASQREVRELSVWCGDQNPHWNRRRSRLYVFPEPTKEGLVFHREAENITPEIGMGYLWSIPEMQTHLSSWAEPAVFLAAHESSIRKEESLRIQVLGQYLVRAQCYGRISARPMEDPSLGDYYVLTSNWILLTVSPARADPTAPPPADPGTTLLPNKDTASTVQQAQKDAGEDGSSTSAKSSSDAQEGESTLGP